MRFKTHSCSRMLLPLKLSKGWMGQETKLFPFGSLEYLTFIV